MATNVAAATAAIGQAVEAAEQAADRSIGRAYVGIVGSHIQAQPSKGVVPIGRNRIVAAEDVARVKEAALPLPCRTTAKITTWCRGAMRWMSRRTCWSRSG